MNLSQQHLQALYKAYCNTHLLWKDAPVLHVKQLDLPTESQRAFLRKLERRLRLGQLAEQFVFNQIDVSKTVELLAENIQIKKDKRTLGELDALITVDERPIHLEIIYKFYVFDDSQGNSELDRWIGTNRKDSLTEKLNKLKTKQLPLLYSDDCKKALKSLELNHTNFEQCVLFKAQLFVPYHTEVEFKLLNKDCLCGFYIKSKQLAGLKAYQFYIPAKLDWFLQPNDTVEWLDYAKFKRDSQLFLDNNQSPLFWLKKDNEELTKGFLVWW